MIECLLSRIGKDNEKTLKLVGCVLFEIVYESEDIKLGTRILTLAMLTIKNFTTNYELCTRLFW